MRINKSKLKQIILEQLKADMGVAIGDDPLRASGDFETNAFTSHLNAILGNLDQMRKVCDEDNNLSRKSLLFFRDKALGDLYEAVAVVERAIDLRLDPPDRPDGF
tara:strand:- start:1073 stop:1387 length:315 start_codon:yes stop_codon:yes gene_type:complete